MSLTLTAGPLGLESMCTIFTINLCASDQRALPPNAPKHAINMGDGT